MGLLVTVLKEESHFISTHFGAVSSLSMFSIIFNHYFYKKTTPLHPFAIWIWAAKNLRFSLFESVACALYLSASSTYSILYTLIKTRRNKINDGVNLKICFVLLQVKICSEALHSPQKFSFLDCLVDTISYGSLFYFILKNDSIYLQPTIIWSRSFLGWVRPDCDC